MAGSPQGCRKARHDRKNKKNKPKLWVNVVSTRCVWTCSGFGQWWTLIGRFFSTARYMYQCILRQQLLVHINLFSSPSLYRYNYYGVAVPLAGTSNVFCPAREFPAVSIRKWIEVDLIGKYFRGFANVFIQLQYERQILQIRDLLMYFKKLYVGM